MPEKLDYSRWKGAALSLSLLAVLCAMIGYMSTAWGVPAEGDYNSNFVGLGLWRYCLETEDGGSNCEDTIGLDSPGWYTATQAVMTVAFILMFTSLVVIVVGECFKKCRPNAVIVISYIIINILSVTLQVTGVALFGTELSGYVFEADGENLKLKTSWSFTVAAIAAGLQLFAWFFGICELLFNKRLSYRLTAIPPVVEMGDAAGETASSSTTTPYEVF